MTHIPSNIHLAPIGLTVNNAQPAYNHQHPPCTNQRPLYTNQQPLYTNQQPPSANHPPQRSHGNFPNDYHILGSQPLYIQNSEHLSYPPCLQDTSLQSQSQGTSQPGSLASQFEPPQRVPNVPHSNSQLLTPFVPNNNPPIPANQSPNRALHPIHLPRLTPNMGTTTSNLCPDFISPDLADQSNHVSEDTISDHPPTPAAPILAPANSCSTDASSKTATKSAKYRLTPDDIMATYEKKTLNQLCDLQRTHIMRKRLTHAMKLEAQDLYFEYQRKQHLLSLRHRRPFISLTKYLGQRRSRQKTTSWHTFQKKNEAAQKAFNDTNKPLGERNKDVSKLYRSPHQPACEVDPEPSNPNDPNEAERSRFGRASKSNPTIRTEVKGWAEGVQLKLKELSDSFGIEGFLVIAAQDHEKPFFFQGGSFLGNEYLRGLVGEGNPIRKFALWTAGSKQQTRKKTTSTPVTQSAGNTNTTPRPKNNTKLALAAFENRDVCQGTLSLNHSHITRVLGNMYLEAQTGSPVKDTRGWPGTDTALKLGRFNRKLTIVHNDRGPTLKDIVNVPIKKMDIYATWRVLRGLKENWIQLVEHQFDTLPPSTSTRKRKRGKTLNASGDSNCVATSNPSEESNHRETSNPSEDSNRGETSNPSEDRNHRETSNPSEDRNRREISDNNNGSEDDSDTSDEDEDDSDEVDGSESDFSGEEDS
ncbi:hypothetical protein PCASD_07000 [Puccinia coronata f. sp. avenae]|uniref:Uncharacterized protein n=1 Tax=Puccinia coronata f. sp. avenae TaxID=200324 RepID=A0A2N5UZR1_9BASI|nr:hypothetical protein PCASD_07000 [Puccinia coronata f. sp. avenae]